MCILLGIYYNLLIPHPRGCGFIFMETEKKAKINLRISTSIDEDGKIKQKVLDYVDHLNKLDLDRHKRMALNEFGFYMDWDKFLERESLDSRIYEVVR